MTFNPQQPIATCPYCGLLHQDGVGDDPCFSCMQQYSCPNCMMFRGIKGLCPVCDAEEYVDELDKLRQKSLDDGDTEKATEYVTEAKEIARKAGFFYKPKAWKRE